MTTNSGDRFRREAKILISGIVIGALIVAIGCAWLKFKPGLPAVLAPTSPKIADIAKETKPCTSVQAFKDPAKKKLNLPEHVQKDEQASVIAAAPVPPSDYPRTATAVLHRDTGIGEIYLQQDTLPWLAFNPRWRFGIFYGASFSASQDASDSFESGVALGTIQYEALQLKKLRATIHAQGSTDSRAFLGGGFTW
jgi:hypothetical protein